MPILHGISREHYAPCMVHTRQKKIRVLNRL